MEKIRIKCPNCGAILEAADTPDNSEKSVICPNCRIKNRFKDFKQVRLGKTVADSDDSTHIDIGARESPGYLVDMSTHREYHLKEGVNLIGRMTVKTPPVADIPIETEDMGISRAHLYIEVIKARDGHYHSYASNAKNKNETYINGTILEDGNKIGLKHDDVITISETRIRFVGTIIDDRTVI